MMFKIFILISLILFSINLQADFLYKNSCINDFYFKNSTFYYHFSKDDNSTWHSSSYSSFSDVYPGFVYDKKNDICSYPDKSIRLGMSGNDFQAVNALMGASLALFLIYAFFFFIKV